MDNQPKKYVKLKDLISKQFTVQKVWGFKWKQWLPGENRMVTAPKWQEGFEKRWELETDQGELEVSRAQFGQMLESVFSDDAARLIDKTFSVKSNGKQGKDVHYYINAVYQKRVDDTPAKEVVIKDIPDDEPMDLSGIPF